MKRKRFEDEILEARNAMHEAAEVIAELAKEEPKIKNRKQDTRLKTQDRKPEAFSPRAIPVFPAADHAKDVENLEKAIMEAGKGGIVLLKARDKSGKKNYFDLSSVTDLSLPFEVSLKSEKDARIKFSD